MQKHKKYVILFIERKKQSKGAYSALRIINKSCEIKELINDEFFELVDKFVAVVIVYFNLYRFRQIKTENPHY